MSTISYRPVDQLAKEWRMLGHCEGSRHAMELLRPREEVVAALVPSATGDLGNLVDALHSPRDQAGRNLAAAGVAALLRSSSAHPLIPRALLQSLVPGLLGVARRLSWGAGGDWEGGGPFFSDLVATAWEVIVEWAGQSRPYAAGDMLSAIRCRSRRQVQAHQAIRSRVALVSPEPALAMGGARLCP